MLVRLTKLCLWPPCLIPKHGANYASGECHTQPVSVLGSQRTMELVSVVVKVLCSSQSRNRSSPATVIVIIIQIFKSLWWVTHGDRWTKLVIKMLFAFHFNYNYDFSPYFKFWRLETSWSQPSECRWDKIKGLLCMPIHAHLNIICPSNRC